MAISKMDRSLFMEQNIIDGNVENDLANSGFENFIFSRSKIFFTITDKYVGRPDLISLDTLGSVDYWAIILKVNDIDDVYNNLVVGEILQIPSLTDVEEIYITLRRKKDLR